MVLLFLDVPTERIGPSRNQHARKTEFVNFFLQIREHLLNSLVGVEFGVLDFMLQSARYAGMRPEATASFEAAMRVSSLSVPPHEASPLALRKYDAGASTLFGNYFRRHSHQSTQLVKSVESFRIVFAQF
jgi:hypothetical protein